MSSTLICFVWCVVFLFRFSSYCVPCVVSFSGLSFLIDQFDILYLRLFDSFSHPFLCLPTLNK